MFECLGKILRDSGCTSSVDAFSEHVTAHNFGRLVISIQRLVSFVYMRQREERRIASFNIARLHSLFAREGIVALDEKTTPSMQATTP